MAPALACSSLAYASVSSFCPPLANRRSQEAVRRRVMTGTDPRSEPPHPKDRNEENDPKHS